MKKKFVALILVLTIFALTVASVLLLTVLPMTLTGCCLNPYHARFNSPYGNNSYLDLDYIESLEIFGTTQKGDVYLVDDKSVFEKALPGYDSTVDFDKQIVLYKGVRRADNRLIKPNKDDNGIFEEVKKVFNSATVVLYKITKYLT